MSTDRLDWLPIAVSLTPLRIISLDTHLHHILMGTFSMHNSRSSSMADKALLVRLLLAVIGWSSEDSTAERHCSTPNTTTLAEELLTTTSSLFALRRPRRPQPPPSRTQTLWRQTERVCHCERVRCPLQIDARKQRALEFGDTRPLQAARRSQFRVWDSRTQVGIAW